MTTETEGGMEYHILNLGAGVQSTTLFLMSLKGEVRPFDLAFFADTQEEPEDVYAHLGWLDSLGGPPILVRTAGKLGDDLVAGRNSTGQRFAAIPAFTTIDEGESYGRTRRQCSKEYKTEVIERAIRRDVLKLQPRKRIPKDVEIHQYFGISLDEKSRATRIWERFNIDKNQKNWQCHFPLLDKGFTRANCILWLERYGIPHKVPRSACVFCPFHSDAEWQRLKDAGGTDWQRAVEVDAALRSDSILQRRHDQTMFVHRSCKPLRLVQLRPRLNAKEMQLGLGGFQQECEGVCGV